MLLPKTIAKFNTSATHAAINTFHSAGKQCQSRSSFHCILSSHCWEQLWGRVGFDSLFYSFTKTLLLNPNVILRDLQKY